MADAISNLFVNLDLRTRDFVSGVADAQREGRALEKVFSPISKTMKDAGAAMTATGTALTAGLTVPLVAAGAFAVKVGIDFESAFAGVRKTVNATEPQLAKLRTEFRDMAKEIPVSAVELSKIGEAAGQLGIKTQDITKFTRVMADLGVTTNLTSDQAATATAQIQNIFGAAGKDVDRFGATLVALGNAGASTEKDIIDMSLRIAGAGHQVGLTQAQTLSFASALSSVGINAEAGGSAISRVFLKINDAVASGGGALDEFARVAGISSATFKKSFETDAAGATTAFIAGLGRLKGQGENVNATLEGLVGKNIIIKDTLLRASGAGDLLTESLKLGNQAWQDNTALTKEAEQRYKTTASQLTILKNQLIDVGITLFDAIGPVLRDVVVPGLKSLVSIVAEAAKMFGGLPMPVQAAAIAIAAVAAAIGPVLVGAGFMATQIGGLIPIFLRLTPLLTGGAGIVGGLTSLGTSLTTAAGLWTAFSAALTVVAVLAAAAAIYKIVEAYAAYRGAVGEAVQANKTAEASTDALAAKLAANGIVIEKAGESLSQMTREQDFFLMSQGVAVEKAARSFGQYHAEVVEAAATAAWFEQVSKKVASSVTASGKATGDMGAAAKTAGSALDDMGEKAKKAGDKAAVAAQNARDQLAALSHFLRGAEDNFERPIKGLNAQLALLSTNVDIATPKLRAMTGPVISEMEALGNSLENNSAFVLKHATDEAAMFAARERDLKNHTKSVSDSTKEWQRVWETAVGNIVSNFSKGVSNLLLHGGKFSVDLKGIFTQLGESLTQIMVTNAFTPIFKAFNDLLSSLTKPITDWISGLISRVTKPLTDALSGLIGGVTDSLTGGLSKAVSSSISGALPGGVLVPGVGGAGGAIGGTAGGASSLAGSFISGGLAAVGSIVGGLISRGNQQRTEENTRESRDWLELMAVAWDPIFNLSMNYLKQIEAHTRVLGEWLLPSLEFWGQNIVDAIGQISTTVGGVVTKAADRTVEASNLVENEVVDAITDLTTTVTGFLNFGVPKFGEAVTKGFLNYGVPKFEEAATKGFLNFGVPKFEEAAARLTAAITKSLPAGTGGASFLNFGVPKFEEAATKGFLNFGVPKFEAAMVKAVASIQAPTANVPPPELFGAGAYARVIPTLFGTHAYSGIATPVAPAAMPSASAPALTVAPEYHVELNVETGAGITEADLRDKVLPTFKRWLDMNTDSLTEEVTVRVKEMWPGVVTVPA